MTMLPNGSAPSGLSRTERKFYDVLCDGRPHAGDELAKCLWDDLGINLRMGVAYHVSNIRRKLPPGFHITTVRIDDKTHYLLVRELTLPPA